MILGIHCTISVFWKWQNWAGLKATRKIVGGSVKCEKIWQKISKDYANRQGWIKEIH